MIVIIDYGMGNLGSIKNMLKKASVPTLISGDVREIESADKLILPGIGAFDNGMRRLQALGMISLLNRKVLIEKTPILGICLGMQLMTRSSEEGQLSGLGWFDAETIRFSFPFEMRELRIPHMGWSQVTSIKASPLMRDMYADPRFYFVHSYHAVCHNSQDALLQTTYGYDFVSGFQKDHIMGVQFHPEKSHKYGMKLLKNFAEEV